MRSLALRSAAGLLHRVFADAVQSLDDDENAAAGCASAMRRAHAWHVHGVFAKAQYVQLLQEAFMDAWVQGVFERLPDGEFV